MTEQLFPCPKCGQLFPMSQLHSHYQSCQSNNYLNQQSFSYPNQALQYPQLTPNSQYNPSLPQAPIYIPPPKPKHNHAWFENDTYKVCLDQSCKQIKLKFRGTWFIFTRYIFKLFWIMFIGEFALALWLVTLTTHH